MSQDLILTCFGEILRDLNQLHNELYLKWQNYTSEITGSYLLKCEKKKVCKYRPVT
jgi:hypothetical protein